MSKAYVNDGYIMLLDSLVFDGKKIGNISDQGIDWGGDPAEYIRLFVAQVRNAPAKKIKKKDSTNVLKFTLVELLPQNCADVMGGTVTSGRWDAPADSVSLEGSVKILAGTGQTIEIKKMTLDGAVRGTLGGDTPLGIECEMEMVKTGSGSPFSIYPTTPFISGDVTELSFSKEGESKIVNIDASGPFSVGAVPAGFSVDVIGGRITVTAQANTGASRGGTVDFILAANPNEKVSVALSQAGNE